MLPTKEIIEIVKNAITNPFSFYNGDDRVAEINKQIKKLEEEKQKIEKENKERDDRLAHIKEWLIWAEEQNTNQ